MAGGIRPNKPRTPEVPFKIKEENAGASKSAAPVAGKGKQVVKLTPQEEAKLKAKIEKQEMKAAIEASIKSENKRVGAGTSGAADESHPSSPTSSKGAFGGTPSLSRSSSMGSNLSELSLPSTSPDSPLPSWMGGDKTPHGSEASTKYFTASSSFGSKSGSEPTTPAGSEPTIPGSSHHTRSMSESSVSAFSLNRGNILDFQKEMTAVLGKENIPGVWHTRTKVELNEPALAHGQKVVDRVIPAHLEPGKVIQPEAPLMYSDLPYAKEIKRMVPPSRLQAEMGIDDHIMAIPEIGSGPSTPKVRPNPDQAGRPEFPGSTSLSSLLASSPASSAKNMEIPETKLPEPAGPQKKNALGNLSTTAKVGIGVATGLTVAAAVTGALLNKGDDSDKDVQI